MADDTVCTAPYGVKGERWFCGNGVCVNGCREGADYYPPNAINPTRPCQICVVQSGKSGWKGVANGTPNPNNGCQICTGVGTKTPSWSTSSDGTLCGADGDGVCSAGVCVTGCEIGGVYYSENAPDPSNACQSCQPGVSRTTWTHVANGTNCGGGLVCSAGVCGGWCGIGGTVYTSNYQNPGNPCQSCQPGLSTSTWTNRLDGASCGTDGVCFAGECVLGCTIGGAYVAAGTIDPSNPCQSCQPGKSTSTWQTVTDGTSCGTGLVCAAGVCGLECTISGVDYLPGTPNPSNSCQLCNPSLVASSWSPGSDGNACVNGDGGLGFCLKGACASSCKIAGQTYSANAVNPANPCENCQPASSTTSWSPTASGTACVVDGGTGICLMDACMSGCWIGGAYYASGALDPTNLCQSCQPGVSTSSWSSLPDGQSCRTWSDGGGTECCYCYAGACET